MLILLACSCVVAVGALLIALFGDVHLSHHLALAFVQHAEQVLKPTDVQSRSGD